MFATLIPVIASLIQTFAQREIKGVPAKAVSDVTGALQKYLTQDAEALKIMEDAVNAARQHDAATFDKDDRFSNRLRSSVRPVCTYVAVGWYVYARVMGLPLGSEDYALIGGMVAFWFGLRPFEKGGRVKGE